MDHNKPLHSIALFHVAIFEIGAWGLLCARYCQPRVNTTIPPSSSMARRTQRVVGGSNMIDTTQGITPQKLLIEVENPRLYKPTSVHRCLIWDSSPRFLSQVHVACCVLDIAKGLESLIKPPTTLRGHRAMDGDVGIALPSVEPSSCGAWWQVMGHCKSVVICYGPLQGMRFESDIDIPMY
ncbi:hypothetical protein H5410_057331 [Solanum commersonii]|uniref:Uncharacterized protein n=1 Tax=Solanum commersonii TaxID=4109 RepID=A0A9J5WPD1_SOLCO|nr:hypothetical protein H5410_057331 [Solanum commersonii]